MTGEKAITELGQKVVESDTSPEVRMARQDGLSEVLQVCGHLQIEVANIRQELALIREDRDHLHELVKVFAQLLSSTSQALLEKEIHAQLAEYEEKQRRRPKWAS